MPSLCESPPGTISRREAASEILKRQAARRGILAFTEYTFPTYAPAWFHRQLCAAVDRWVAGEIKNLMLWMPPQHGKSEVISRRLPAYIYGRFPDDAIVHASYGAELVEDFSADIRGIMNSEQYRAIFPGTKLGGKQRVNDWRIDGHRGRYRCAGKGGGISGRSAQWLILDDPLKGRNEAESVAERDSVWRWLGGDFFTRAAGDTRCLVVGTPWHPDDPMGRLLQKQAESPDAKQWHHIRFPALCESQDNPDDPRKIGEYLWPERFSAAHYRNFRESFPTDWASLYQLRPRGSGMVEWPDEFFGPSIWFTDWPACPLICKVMGLDPSKGKSDKSGDFSAIIEMGVDQDGILWVDADLDNGRPVEAPKGQRSMVNDGLDRMAAFRPTGFIVETNGFQELVATAFLRTAAERGIQIPLYAVNNTDPKVSRIRSLGPYLSQGRLRVRNTPGGRLLVQQLREFPTGAHDDGPDALKTTEMLADYLLTGHKAGGGVTLMRT